MNNTNDVLEGTIIRRGTEETERGLNGIISRIRFLKDVNYDHIDFSSAAAVESHLDDLKEIAILEDVLRMFSINSCEYEDVYNTTILLNDK